MRFPGLRDTPLPKAFTQYTAVTFITVEREFSRSDDQIIAGKRGKSTDDWRPASQYYLIWTKTGRSLRDGES